jgi:hypothetical protein
VHRRGGDQAVTKASSKPTILAWMKQVTTFYLGIVVLVAALVTVLTHVYPGPY